MKYKDYYQVLGVDRSATDSVIKKTYRTLARKYHPDVNSEPEAQHRFQEISEAYEVLSDTGKRKRYDQLGARWQQGQDFSPPRGWNTGHSGCAGSRGCSGQGDGGFSDFFDSIFGDMMGGGPSAGRSRVRQDDEVSLSLTLEEAYRGGQKKFSIGQGVQAKTYTLRIPSRIGDGSKLRMKGQGKSGDLLVCISIQPHSRFSVQGADIEAVVELSVPQAVLGSKVELSLPEGQATLKIPAGMQPGKRLRLKGKGLKTSDGGEGDLYVVAKMAVPTQLSAEERSLYEQLEALRGV